MPKYAGSKANWNPGAGKPHSDKRVDELMSTEASDAKETMTGTNDLKPFIGGSGKPKGPFGQKAREF